MTPVEQIKSEISRLRAVASGEYRTENGITAVDLVKETREAFPKLLDVVTELVKAVKKLSTPITVTDGCDECSAFWSRELTLRAPAEAIEKAAKILGGGEMSFVSTDSSKQETHTWLTPLWLVRSLGQFDLDPCAYPGHQTAKNLIALPVDGLAAKWFGRVWLNPPYGKHAVAWMERLSNHGDGTALLFCRLETQWLKPFLRNGFFVIDGRICFESPISGKKGHAGTANILIPFGRKNIGAILSSDIKGEWYQ